jgi:hypothetical protein
MILDLAAGHECGRMWWARPDSQQIYSGTGQLNGRGNRNQVGLALCDLTLLS